MIARRSERAASERILSPWARTVTAAVGLGVPVLG